MIDAMTAATRFFDTPHLIEPRKAAVIARALGPRFLRLEDSAAFDLVGADIKSPDKMERTSPRMGSLLADGLFQRVKQYGGYSVVQGVAVIPIIGTLVRRGSYIGQSSGVTSYEGISAQVRAAKEDPEVRAIAFEVDSFGGEAAGAFDLASEIRDLRDAKPVMAVLAENACSAGYLLAAQADRISIPAHGEAGSIGVVSMHVDYEDKLANDGVRVTLIASGLHKTDGNPFEHLPDEVRAEMQSRTDALRVEFAQAVADGRGTSMTAEAALRTEAGCYTGANAVAAGLCDTEMSAREAFAQFVEEMNPPVRVAGRAAPIAANRKNTLDLKAAAPSGAQLVSELVGMLAGEAEIGEPAAEAVLPKTGLGPITGAAAPIIEETDMSKTVEQASGTAPEATAAAVPNSTGSAAPKAAGNSAPANTPNTAAGKADATWVMEKCEASGLGLDVAKKIVAQDMTREAALEAILDAKASRADDGGEIRAAGQAAQVTGDARDRTMEGIKRALYSKTRLDGGERNEFASMSLREMARASLSAQGIHPKGGTMEFAGAVFAPAMASGGMHSTSDFTAILVDVANKSMLKGFSETEESFEQFTSVGTLTDFKATKRIGLDEFPVLTKVEEGAEFSHGTVGDHSETAILATYGKLFALTRQTIINDDLDAFSRIPMKMGRAARRTVGDLVFAVLTGNPAMSDGTALFHADHKNLASTGNAPSEATINAAINAMMTQTDRSENANALNIPLRYLVLPPKWRSAALQALNSEYAPDDTDKAGSAKQPRAYNTVKDAATPIFDARLKEDAWFGLADPAMHDTIEVGYLDGNPAPFLDQQDGWSIDGTEFKVRIDATATPLAYQTAYKNPGS